MKREVFHPLSISALFYHARFPLSRGNGRFMPGFFKTERLSFILPPPVLILRQKTTAAGFTARGGLIFALVPVYLFRGNAPNHLFKFPAILGDKCLAGGCGVAAAADMLAAVGGPEPVGAGIAA